MIKPGSLTLILGPPGAGKSVFVQTLSGRLNEKSVRVSGTIKYNGEQMDSFVVQRTAGLVDQYDYHIPNLTVAETVKFAAACQTPQKATIDTLVLVDKAEIEARNVAEREAALVEEGRSGGGVQSIIPEGDHEEEGGGVASEGGENIGTDSMSQQTGTPTDQSQEDAEAAAKAEYYELLRDGVLYQVRPYITMQILGLSRVANTFVGNESLRGVSGGERKRVTSAEILAGPQWVEYMDEISTGLDSATTYSVIQSLGNVCHSLKRTILVSLLQPAPEVMYLFDDLLLLTDGKVIYHGPVSEATAFFASLGFICPPRKDPASFLQEVTTPLGQLTYASAALLDEHRVSEEMRDPVKLLTRPPKKMLISVDSMSAEFWTNTTHGAAMKRQLETAPFDPATGNPAALARTHYARSGAHLAMLALRRQFILICRDKAYYIARVVQAVVIGLIISSLFASVAPPSVDDENYSSDVFSQGRKSISLCVLSVIYISMSSMPALGFVFNTKRVFYKQRDNHFFPSWAYVVGLLLAQVVPSTLESVLFAVVVYFISGLTRTVSRFFIYLLVTWSSSNCLAGLFRLIAYVAPNMVMGNAAGAMVLLFLMITNVSEMFD